MKFTRSKHIENSNQLVKGFFNKYYPQFKQPLRLSSVLAQGLEQYAAIFVPGGHGALIGLPVSRDVGAALEWSVGHNRFVISLCHGPAAFLAVGDSDIYRGYKICAFPDALDAQPPDIGYMPGHLTWKFGERLKALGLGHRDRERWHLGRGAPGPATHHGRQPAGWQCARQACRQNLARGSRGLT